MDQCEHTVANLCHIVVIFFIVWTLHVDQCEHTVANLCHIVVIFFTVLDTMWINVNTLWQINVHIVVIFFIVWALCGSM